MSIQQGLKLKHTQLLSQQMRQSLRVLQMSNQEIEHEIENWLADNPLLERIKHEREPEHHSIDADPELWQQLVQEDTLQQHLLRQISEHPVSERHAACIRTLIDFLDDQGYFCHTLHDVLEQMPIDLQIQEDELAHALEQLRGFEPAGIATANLSQSLLYQLERLPNTPVRRCAIKIAAAHLSELGSSLSQNTQRIAKALPEFSAATVKAALNTIATLNPYPAYGFSVGAPTVYIQADIYVSASENGWQLDTNSDAWPQLQLNPELAGALQAQANLSPDWKERVSHAKFSVEILQQRKKTVLRIAEYILDKQKDFFTFGEIGMMPLLLKDCAAALGLAESTVSRAVSGKYLACPRGLFPLRYFFSQHAVSKRRNSDEGISAVAVKSLISQLVAQENKNKPLSDLALHKLLQQQGIELARRTVAKYREQLGIPSVQHRRQI